MTDTQLDHERESLHDALGPTIDTQRSNAIQIKKMRPWHEQVVDWMLENPHKNHEDCAYYFNKTKEWICMLTNTDIFREYRARRYAEHHQRVSADVINKVSGLAGLSLDVLQERISAERDKIPLGIVKDSAELALKSMGYGPRPAAAPGTTVVLNVNGASPALLAEARGDLKRLHQDNTEDAEIVNRDEKETTKEPQLPLFGEV